MNTVDDLRESHARSILKAVTYRIIGTLTTGVLVFTVSGDFKLSLAITALEPLVKTVVYYLHERAWQRLPRGRVRQLLQRHAR